MQRVFACGSIISLRGLCDTSTRNVCKGERSFDHCFDCEVERTFMRLFRDEILVAFLKEG